MSFPAYPNYKILKVVWYGDIPQHWQVRRYKEIFKERAERSATGGEELLSVSEYYGVKSRALTLDDGEHLSRAESLEGYKVCYCDDLVMNIMLAWKRGLGFAWQKGIVSPAYSVFRVMDGSDPRFLYYLLRSDESIRYFKAYSTGVIDSRLRLYPESFGRLYTVTPPKHEQQKIAAFLDHETAKIDALIAEQQRLIKLLKEKRQAVISHAVTKGLNPDAPMKDSGVEWLGEVPAHWKVSKFGYVSIVVRGGSPRPAGDPELFGGNYSPWVTVAEITRGDSEFLRSTESFLTKKGSHQCRVFNNGTLLLSNSGATLGVPKILCMNANANDGVVGFENLKIDTEFSYYYLSTLTDGLRNRIKQGSGQPNLNTNLIKNIPVPIPPDEEVKIIVAMIKKVKAGFYQLGKEAESSISYLEERRSAIISFSVTGKVDVRGWQSSEPASPEAVSRVTEEAASYG